MNKPSLAENVSCETGTPRDCFVFVYEEESSGPFYNVKSFPDSSFESNFVTDSLDNLNTFISGRRNEGREVAILDDDSTREAFLGPSSEWDEGDAFCAEFIRGLTRDEINKIICLVS